ncbi:MAG: cupredoxin domain-containing protein [Elainellaceae cyanobacterium]
MQYRAFTFGALASLGLLFSLATATPAQMTPDRPAQASVRRVEQPLWTKALVTGGGLGLVGLELWWFVLSKPKTGRAKIDAKSGGDVQEITVTVDGGYDPSRIVVQAGRPVRLNFYRTDRSSCLSEVRFPDFRIAKTLPVNQTTPIEFTPEAPGRYEFACGMAMFRGTVEAVESLEAVESSGAVESSEAVTL